MKEVELNKDEECQDQQHSLSILVTQKFNEWVRSNIFTGIMLQQ